MRRLWFFRLISMLLLAWSTAASAERRVALVIGIDKYDNLPAHAQLAKARSDAAAVARLLGEIGFDVIFKEDVTRSAFNSAWQDLLNRLTPGDTAVLYFAGHGIEFSGRTYLVPRDVPNLKPGRDELLRREALSLQEFLADLREKGTRLNVIILDACRDNPFEQVAGRSVGSRRGLGVTEPPEGTFIMYSAGAGESALDRLGDTDHHPNSVYTRHLLPLLRSPGLSLTEVAEQVRVSVRQLAATVQHRQTPAYYNQVLGRACLVSANCAPDGASVPALAAKSQAEIAKMRAEVEAARALAQAELAKAEALRLKARTDMERAKAEAERAAAEIAKARADAELAKLRAQTDIARVETETELALARTGKQRQALLPPRVDDTTVLFNPAAMPSFNCREYAATPLSSPGKNPQTDLFCIEPEVARVDFELGRVFRDNINRLSAARKREAIATQKQWILERNRRCPASWGDLEVPERRAQIGQCLIRETLARIQQLRP